MLIVDYSPEYGTELVRMWRDSFEQAVGITDTHSLVDQLRYLEEKVVPENRVQVVLEEGTSAVIAFLASTRDFISQLYVHVEHQNKGIGSALLKIAKRDSSGSLRLFTFEANKRAQRFYEKHGFRVVRCGFEPTWQLADIEYEWRRPPSFTADRQGENA